MGSAGMLTTAKVVAHMLFYLEIWANVPPDFHCQSGWEPLMRGWYMLRLQVL